MIAGVGIAACGGRGSTSTGTSTSTSTSTSASASTGTGTGTGTGASTSTGTGTSTSASTGTGTGTSVARVVDAEEEGLGEGAIAGVKGARSALGAVVLEATVGGRAVVMEPATGADPLGYRRPLAFARLARALGARGVPASALRHVGAGELSALAEGSKEAAALVREARVLNDGTVDVLVSARAPEAAQVDVAEGREVGTWELWARSASARPGEDAALLRDYVWMLVLDYLAANMARRTALLVRGDRKALVLADNHGAFAPRPDGPTLDKMLRRLRAVERWPKGMFAALRAFDRARAEATFVEGGFATRLLAPRVLIDLDERRAALVTLLDAKIGARGVDAVECL